LKYTIDIAVIFGGNTPERDSSNKRSTRTNVVGDISGFFQNSITTTCCMAPAKRRTVIKPALVVFTFGILKIFKSALNQK
jgi:hypothetical protein